MDAIIRIRLNQMPFDKYSDGEGFIHSTGYECVFKDGTSAVEYEDYIYDDADDCVVVDEDEYYASEEDEDEYYASEEGKEEAKLEKVGNVLRLCSNDYSPYSDMETVYIGTTPEIKSLYNSMYRAYLKNNTVNLAPSHCDKARFNERDIYYGLSVIEKDGFMTFGVMNQKTCFTYLYDYLVQNG